jgi:hypothetical protein
MGLPLSLAPKDFLNERVLNAPGVGARVLGRMENGILIRELLDFRNRGGVAPQLDQTAGNGCYGGYAQP